MIRAIEDTDIEAVTTIYNHYVTSSIISFEELPVSTAELSGRIKAVQNLHYPWLVAEEEKNIVGFAYAGKCRERSAYKHSVEITVYLAPEYTAKGWGSKLYQALFEELKKEKVHVVIAGIALPNPASVALHEKMGLQKVAHFKEVGFKFNQWIDVGYWQAALE
jgi:phosphinothricin acetyltransferase